MFNLEASPQPSPEPTRRTPRTLYLALLKDQPRPTALIQITRAEDPESQDSESPAEGEHESNNVVNASAIDPVYAAMLCNKLQEAQEIGRSLQLRIHGESSNHRLEVPANADLSNFAERALALADGDLEAIEIRIEEITLREMFSDQLRDVFPGSIKNFSKLEELLLARCDVISEDSLGAWLDMMPTQEEFAQLGEEAQRNIIKVLEVVLEMNDFVEASYMAGSYLLALPNYEPDPSKGNTQAVWCARTSACIFKTLTGVSPNAITSGVELLAAVTDQDTKCVNSQALILYLEAVRLLGERATTVRVISEFLDSEIPELADSSLANLGQEAFLTLEQLRKTS